MNRAIAEPGIDIPLIQIQRLHEMAVAVDDLSHTACLLALCAALSLQVSEMSRSAPWRPRAVIPVRVAAVREESRIFCGGCSTSAWKPRVFVRFLWCDQ